MITKEEVRHIAKLARLGLTEKEVEKYQKELSSILDYVGKLKEIDTELLELSSASHPFGLENIMREDQENIRDKMQGAKLLKLAPQTKNGYLKVRPIIRPSVRPS